MVVIEQFTCVSTAEVIVAVFFSVIIYIFLLLIYRVYFSPLSRFPGPRLAAATLWYEFYFDVVKRGRFAWEIKRMHELYGPVVRINPFELHVSEPDFYEELYAGQMRKRNKLDWSADMFICPDSILSTVDHDLHRKRRAPLAPYFSLSAIRRFDTVIRSKLELLSQKFENYRKSGQPINLDVAFTALTTDIITQYSFGISYDFLEANEFNPEWLPLLKGASEQSLLTKQMPWLTRAMRKIPVAWLVKVKPEMANLVRFQAGIDTCLREVMSGSVAPSKKNECPTVFHGLLQSSLPASELSLRRLQGEGETLVAAGTLTTAHYLRSTVYHILANPAILCKLHEELKPMMSNPALLPPFNELDQAPYLRAVINEGFRLSHGIIARLTRVAPDEVLEVAGYKIPAGTPLSMSSWLVHMNPDLFSSPDEFQPERWLEPGANHLKKYLVNFTKGSRTCLGKDLARMEIVYTLALIVGRWVGEDGNGMELFETTRADADIEHDFFNPFPRSESKGIRVLLK